MKKNYSMRIASMLLVLVLLTTCVISGTFAKYVTSDSAEDSARVAKWGVTVKATDAGTFEKEYAADDSTFTLATNTVVSSDSVLAPGTKGEFTRFDIAGTPEVAVRVTYVATVDLGDKWEDKDGNYYCPLVVTVGTTTIEGLLQTDAEAFETAIKNAIEACKADYKAGDDLSDVEDDVVIKWSWAYSTSADNDIKDTYLGDQAAEGNAAQISLTVSCTITQID